MIYHLNRHLLGHTNAKLGFTFTNQDIDVREVKETDGTVTIEPEIDATISMCINSDNNPAP